MTVLNVVFSIFLLIVLSWVAVFGGVGGLLARTRGGSAAAGIAWGTLLGPFGWLGIVWTTRETRREARAAAAFVGIEDVGGSQAGSSWDE